MQKRQRVSKKAKPKTDKWVVDERVMQASLAILNVDVSDSHKVHALLQDQALARHYYRIGFKTK